MNQLTMEEIKLLNEKAKNIRIDILKAITKANSGHIQRTWCSGIVCCLSGERIFS